MRIQKKYESVIHSHLKMLKTSYNQLPFFRKIGIGSLWEWTKYVIIYKPEDANESEKKKKIVRGSFSK